MENTNNIPRRNQLNLNIPAEIAIQNAINEIEVLGANEVLTDIVIMLNESKNMLSDYIDGIKYSRNSFKL